MQFDVRNILISKCNLTGKFPFLITQAKENSSSILKSNSILVLSHTHFDIYKQKNSELKASFQWSSLTNYSQKDNQIKIKFKKTQISIDCAEANICTDVIQHILHQIFPSFILKDIVETKKVYPKVLNSNYAAFIKFKNLAESKGLNLTKELLKNVERLCRFSYSFFTIHTLPDYPRYCEIFYQTLPLLTFINHLVIPVDTCFNQLCQNISVIGNIKSINFNGRVPNHFNDFLKRHEKAPLNAKAISFTHNEFSKDDITYIRDFLLKQDITSLGFHSAFELTTLNAFYSSILIPGIVDKLSVLNLENTRNLDFIHVAKSCKNIVLLSVANCSLQLPTVLTILKDEPMPKLKFLNLSGNISGVAPPADSFFPVTLYSLMLNDIDWIGDSLFGYIGMLFDQDLNPLKLSISKAKAQAQVWRRVFSLMSVSEYCSLSALTWDGNPVSQKFFQFLHRNQHLDFLSLSECFRFSIKESIIDLSLYISNTRHLKFLIVRGGDSMYLGNMCSPVIKSVSQSQSIVHLDISENKIGDVGTNALKSIVRSHASLQIIAFDGSDPESANDFLDLLNAASQNKRLKCSFPDKDLNFLIEQNKITEERRNQILALFSMQPHLQKTSEGEFVEPPPDSPFLEPFNVFYYQPASQFPNHVSDEALESIMNPKALPVQPKVHNRRRATSVKASSVKDLQLASGRKMRKPIVDIQEIQRTEPLFMQMGIGEDLIAGFDSESSCSNFDDKFKPNVIVDMSAQSQKNTRHKSTSKKKNKPESKGKENNESSTNKHIRRIRRNSSGSTKTAASAATTGAIKNSTKFDVLNEKPSVVSNVQATHKSKTRERSTSLKAETPKSKLKKNNIKPESPVAITNELEDDIGLENERKDKISGNMSYNRNSSTGGSTSAKNKMNQPSHTSNASVQTISNYEKKRKRSLSAREKSASDKISDISNSVNKEYQNTQNVKGSMSPQIMRKMRKPMEVPFLEHKMLNTERKLSNGSRVEGQEKKQKSKGSNNGKGNALESRNSLVSGSSNGKVSDSSNSPDKSNSAKHMPFWSKFKESSSIASSDGEGTFTNDHKSVGQLAPHVKPILFLREKRRNKPKPDNIERIAQHIQVNKKDVSNIKSKSPKTEDIEPLTVEPEPRQPKKQPQPIEQNNRRMERASFKVRRHKPIIKMGTDSDDSDFLFGRDHSVIQMNSPTKKHYNNDYFEENTVQYENPVTSIVKRNNTFIVKRTKRAETTPQIEVKKPNASSTNSSFAYNSISSPDNKIQQNADDMNSNKKFNGDNSSLTGFRSRKISSKLHNNRGNSDNSEKKDVKVHESNSTRSNAGVLREDTETITMEDEENDHLAKKEKVNKKLPVTGTIEYDETIEVSCDSNSESRSLRRKYQQLQSTAANQGENNEINNLEESDMQSKKRKRGKEAEKILPEPRKRKLKTPPKLIEMSTAEYIESETTKTGENNKFNELKTIEFSDDMFYTSQKNSKADKMKSALDSLRNKIHKIDYSDEEDDGSGTVSVFQNSLRANNFSKLQEAKQLQVQQKNPAQNQEDTEYEYYYSDDESPNNNIQQYNYRVQPNIINMANKQQNMNLMNQNYTNNMQSSINNQQRYSANRVQFNMNQHINAEQQNMANQYIRPQLNHGKQVQNKQLEDYETYYSEPDSPKQSPPRDGVYSSKLVQRNVNIRSDDKELSPATMFDSDEGSAPKTVKGQITNAQRIQQNMKNMYQQVQRSQQSNIPQIMIHDPSRVSNSQQNVYNKVNDGSTDQRQIVNQNPQQPLAIVEYEYYYSDEDEVQGKQTGSDQTAQLPISVTKSSNSQSKQTPFMQTKYKPTFNYQQQTSSKNTVSATENPGINTTQQDKTQKPNLIVSFNERQKLIQQSILQVQQQQMKRELENDKPLTKQQLIRANLNSSNNKSQFRRPDANNGIDIPFDTTDSEPNFIFQENETRPSATNNACSPNLTANINALTSKGSAAFSTQHTDLKSPHQSPRIPMNSNI